MVVHSKMPHITKESNFFCFFNTDVYNKVSELIGP